MVVRFPATAANVPATPLVTGAFCQAIVPVAFVKVRVVPVPVQTEAASAESSPTAVGWLTVTATAAETAGVQAPLEVTTLYQVVAVGAAV